MDADSLKKASLDDLPKDELIKKCKGLLNILQKAKQSKESLIQENNDLKEKLKTTETDGEMLESLIQQKVQLVTSLEETKSQKKVLENKLKECECNLTTASDRIVNLDNENQGCRRQITRLVEENEQLLNRLDSLEKETESLKNIGIKQQEQLLHLEKNSITFSETSYEALNTKYVELQVIYNQIESTNAELIEKHCELKTRCEELHVLEESNNKSITELKKTTEEKNAENLQLQGLISNQRVRLDEQEILIDQLKSNCDSLQGLTDLQEVNNKLKDKIKLFHSKLVKFAGDVKSLKHEKNELLINFKDYVHQVKLWENQLKEFSCNLINQFKEFDNAKSQYPSEYESLKIKYDIIEKENTALTCNNKDLSDTIKTLKSKINSEPSERLNIDNKVLTEKLNNVIKEIEVLKEELELLKTERSALKVQYQSVINDSQAESLCLQDENASLVQIIQQQLAELNIYKSHNKTLEQNVFDYQATINKLEYNLSEYVREKEIASEHLHEVERNLASFKTENNELLMEMNEMNQVLKERGETISKQQEYCEELLKNVKMQEAQTKVNLELINKKDGIIKQLEENLDVLKNSALNQVVDVPKDNRSQDAPDCVETEEVVSLKNEIAALKDKLLHLQDAASASNESCYAESETLSTSTISRTEEISRLKDLEGSWEERYGKLRSLAVKLKQKVHALSEQLAKDQSEKQELQLKLANSHKTIQMLQSQCDALHDDLDSNKAELKGYTKQLDLAATNKSTHLRSLAENEEIITKLKLEIEALNKEKCNTDTWKKQVSAKVQNLKRELDSNSVVRKELEEQIKIANLAVDEKSKLLNEEIDKHNATKNILLESHNECKKQSVLNLEIQDYERSLKETAQKLERKQESITKLKNQVDQQNSVLSSLKEQNRLLEERIDNEEKDLDGARGELLTYKKRAADLETTVMEKDEKLLHLTHTLENSRAEVEELSTHLTKVVADNQKACESLKNDKQLLQMQNSGLEVKLRELSDNIKLKEEQLAEIYKEYEGYKVRAQSVLRSNQVRDVGLEEKLTGEVASFRAQVDVLTADVMEHKKSYEKLKDENCQLMLEKESAEIKLRKLEGLLEEQKQLHDVVTNKHQKTVLENSETISSLKVHADMLSQCYRQQLSEQETRHNKEIIELQSRIEKASPVLENLVTISPSTPREQGEGSESVDVPTSTIKINHPLPLDKLLNSEMEQDLGFLRKQISEHETKVNYLTSLLADTEQDLVKHVQMNKVLKEEIRRYQRSVEREKHAENLEYLKNIVFKFATLNNGDERTRLVPVLNTILKFSPEETHQLNLVAKGEVYGRGWSGYLTSWTGGKPQ